MLRIFSCVYCLSLSLLYIYSLDKCFLLWLLLFTWHFLLSILISQFCAHIVVCHLRQPWYKSIVSLFSTIINVMKCDIWQDLVMTNLDSIFKSRDITLPTKVRLVKAMVFPVVMYGCESWTVKKLSTEELMLLNCGVGKDSWVSLGLQGDPTSPFWRRSPLGFLWKEWC